MSSIIDRKWRLPLSYKNGLYLMYHVMKGKKDENNGGERVVFSDEKIDRKAVFYYSCSSCGISFTLISSFLLHMYRHSDPYAIQKDIKKEEELDDQKFSYLKNVEEAEALKSEEIKEEEDVKPEINNSSDLILPSKYISSANTTNVHENFQNFTCHYCIKTFTYKKLLKKHLSCHSSYFIHQFEKSQSSITCDICVTKFHIKENLKEHYFKSHKRTSRICRICKCNVGSNLLRKIHEQFFHDITGFDCISCRFGFHRIEKLREHVFKIHEDMQIQRCVYCVSEFRDKRMLITHIVESHTSKIKKIEREALDLLLRPSNNANQCSYCNKKFTNEKLARLHEVRQHLVSLEDNPGYTCKICNSSFSKRENGLRHARRMHRTHENKCESVRIETPKENNFTCNECGKTFPNTRALILHSRNVHSTKELIFQCGVCDKRVKSFKALRDHIEALHEKAREFICDLCGKGHATKSRLRTHINVNHITNRNHVCSICNQRFSQLGQLNVHKKIHLTKKLHTCPVCQKSFAQLSGLHQHVSMHSETPKYTCAICQRSFKYASSFYNHRKSYHSTTEFKCIECNRQCPSRFSLYAHKKAHHSSVLQQFDCSECGKIFKRKDTLKYHILNKHTPHIKYKCDYCDKGFKTKRERKFHMRTDHTQLF